MVRREIRRAVGRNRPQEPLRGLASVAERLALVATELAGNALRHATPPVDVRLQVGADGWLLVVSDPRPGEGPAVREREPDVAGGQGLHLVWAVSDLVGWYTAHGRKTVWALVGDEPPPGLQESLRRVTR